MGADALVLLTALLASLHGQVGGQSSSSVIPSVTPMESSAQPAPSTTTAMQDLPTSSPDMGSGFTSSFEPLIPTSDVVTSTPTPIQSSSPAFSPPLTTSSTSTTDDSATESAPTTGTRTTLPPSPTQSLLGQVLGGAVAGAVVVEFLVFLIIIIMVLVIYWKRAASRPNLQDVPVSPCVAYQLAEYPATNATGNTLASETPKYENLDSLPSFTGVDLHAPKL